MNRPQQKKKRRPSQPSQPCQPRPPRYPTEQPMGDRTPEKDKLALQMAVDAYQKLIQRPQRNLNPEDDNKVVGSWRAQDASKGIEKEQTESACEKDDDELASILKAYQPETKVDSATIWPPRPDVMLPLTSMYPGTWPKKDDPVPGATQYSWSTIGFPENRAIILKEYEDCTHIDKQHPAIADLARDIVDVRKKRASEVADGGIVDTHEEHERVIETFRVHTRTVAKIRIKDCSVFDKGRPYSRCEVSRAFEDKLDRTVGSPPDLAVEQRVAARVLLARGGQIGGRSQDYWRKARDLAQQELYKNPNLETTIREEMKEDNTDDDSAFTMMLRLVRESITTTTKSANPYHQSKRDQYAVDHGLFHKVDAEIAMVLDKADNIIAFQLANAFGDLLPSRSKTDVQSEAARSIEMYSTLQPVPVPDMTRHGLHWVDWLGPAATAAQHPEFDCRVRGSDPRRAKSGVYRFGLAASAGDPGGRLMRGPMVAKDTWTHIDSGSTSGSPAVVKRQLRTLRYTALGACSELASWLFELLDPGLRDRYRDVAAKASEVLQDVPFETRRYNRDVFTHWAVAINVMSNDHRDRSDWQHGLSSLVSLGDFRGGGDLLLRELGLQIAGRPGSAQLLRSRELSHSTSRWAGGRRFVVAAATHEAVRRWALREMEEEEEEEAPPVSGSTPASVDSCVEVEQEDAVPEDLEEARRSCAVLDAWRAVGGDDEEEEEEDEEEDERFLRSIGRARRDSSASDTEFLPRVGRGAVVRGGGGGAARAESTSDADGEESGDGIMAVLRKGRKKHRGV